MPGADRAPGPRCVGRGESGSEYFGLVFAPLFLVMPFFMVTGTLSALGLALDSREIALRACCAMAAAGFGIWMVLSFIMFIRTALQQWKESREHNRIMSREEMLDLISSSAIRSFTDTGNYVELIYQENRDSDGRYIYKARRADSAGYQAYVAAANQARRLGVDVYYFNRIGRNDPSSAGTRWLSVAEARALLLSGAIDAFHCGRRDPYPAESATGQATGIKITDFGWVRHLYVEPGLASTMVPIARNAAVDGMRIYVEAD